MRINVEHILPMSKGGQTNSKNMVISPPCNKGQVMVLIKKRLKKLYKQSKEYNKSYEKIASARIAMAKHIRRKQKKYQKKKAIYAVLIGSRSHKSFSVRI